MRYHMSQAELQIAIEFYLNKNILREPAKVHQVVIDEQAVKDRGDTYVLHVIVTDDQAETAKKKLDEDKPRASQVADQITKVGLGRTAP